MRSIDKFRKRHSKNNDNDEQNKWDFIINDLKPVKKLPITLFDANNETDIEQFERFNRQLTKCIAACSLCSDGLKEFRYNNDIRIPQFAQSIWYKKLVFIKYKPTNEDINGLFNYSWLTDILNEANVNLNDLYLSTIKKCVGDSNYKCPYFNLEFQKLIKCNPKLIIIFDKESANYLNLEFKNKTIIKLGMTNVYLTNGNYDKNIKKILKSFFN